MVSGVCLSSRSSWFHNLFIHIADLWNYRLRIVFFKGLVHNYMPFTIYLWQNEADIARFVHK